MRKHTFTIFLICLAVACVICFCYYVNIEYSSHRKMHDQMENVVRKNESMQTIQDTLRADIETLRVENDSLKRVNEALEVSFKQYTEADNQIYYNKKKKKR